MSAGRRDQRRRGAEARTAASAGPWAVGGDAYALLAAVFEGAANGVAIVGMDGHAVEANPALERMLGYTVAELREMAFDEFAHPDDASAGWDLFHELVAGAREHYQMHERFVRKDGTTFWGRLTVSLIRSPDGAPRFVVTKIEDVSEQRNAERRLAESEAMLQAIVESEPECVKLVGPDGELLQMNPAGLRMIEAGSAEEVIGTSVYDIVAPEHRPAYRALTEAAVRGHGGRLEFDIIGLRGTRRSMDTHAAPFRDGTGQIVACLSITRDVSERKRAQAELERTKGELLEIFSHELFTPIAVIQGSALTFAKRGAELAPEDHRVLADGVERASQRLDRLVGNLSAAARLDRGRMVLGTKATRIQDVVALATARFSGESERLEVTLPEEPIGVEVDLGLASTALVIVVENALDLSDGQVGIGLEPRPGWVVVSVSDHGPGVPEEDKEAIFEAFTQADPGPTRAHEGIGIGLYLARRIMQAHGGTIEAVDRPGYGAVFELSFPAEPVGQIAEVLPAPHPPIDSG